MVMSVTLALPIGDETAEFGQLGKLAIIKDGKWLI